MDHVLKPSSFILLPVSFIFCNFFSSKYLSAVSGTNSSIAYNRNSVMLLLMVAKFTFFCLYQGVLAESVGSDSDNHIFTIVSDMVDPNKTGINNTRCEGILAMDEECERSVASVEEQLRKEMTVYEVWFLPKSGYLFSSLSAF